MRKVCCFFIYMYLQGEMGHKHYFRVDFNPHKPTFIVSELITWYIAIVDDMNAIGDLLICRDQVSKWCIMIILWNMLFDLDIFEWLPHMYHSTSIRLINHRNTHIYAFSRYGVFISWGRISAMCRQVLAPSHNCCELGIQSTQYSYRNKIMHKPRQHSCRDMWKIW